MSASDAAGQISLRLQGAAPACGATQVIAIDGRSGSGKSTLAQAIAAQLGGVIVGLEDLYGGWDGLEQGVSLLASAVLRPFSEGRSASVPRYDWLAQTWALPRTLEPPPLLLIEGAGAGARALAGHTNVLVWLDLGTEDRRDRALARVYGELYGPHWQRWALQEDAFYEREAPRERADLVIDAAQTAAEQPCPEWWSQPC